MTVVVPAQELYAYRQGALIQDAFKSLSAADREFLYSGTSEKGWKQVFGAKDLKSEGVIVEVVMDDELDDEY